MRAMGSVVVPHEGENGREKREKSRKKRGMGGVDLAVSTGHRQSGRTGNIINFWILCGSPTLTGWR